MGDLYDAVAQKSAALAIYVEELCKRRGWSARTVSGMLLGPSSSRELPRLTMIYGASVLLPFGRAASFFPARRPRVDGQTWMIEIHRSDGVSRPQWNGGIAIKPQNGSYTLMIGNRLLDEETLSYLLEAIGEP